MRLVNGQLDGIALDPSFIPDPIKPTVLVKLTKEQVARCGVLAEERIANARGRLLTPNHYMAAFVPDLPESMPPRRRTATYREEQRWGPEIDNALITGCRSVPVTGRATHRHGEVQESYGRNQLIAHEIFHFTGCFVTPLQVTRRLILLRKKFQRDSAMLDILNGKVHDIPWTPRVSLDWPPEIDDALIRAARKTDVAPYEKRFIDGEPIGRNEFISQEIYRATGQFRSYIEIAHRVGVLKKKYADDPWTLSILKGELADLAPVATREIAQVPATYRGARITVWPVETIVSLIKVMRTIDVTPHRPTKGIGEPLGRNQLLSQKLFEKTGERRDNKQITTLVVKLRRKYSANPRLMAILNGEGTGPLLLTGPRLPGDELLGDEPLGDELLGGRLPADDELINIELLDEEPDDDEPLDNQPFDRKSSDYEAPGDLSIHNQLSDNHHSGDPVFDDQPLVASPVPQDQPINSELLQDGPQTRAAARLKERCALFGPQTPAWTTVGPSKRRAPSDDPPPKSESSDEGVWSYEPSLAGSLDDLSYVDDSDGRESDDGILSDDNLRDEEPEAEETGDNEVEADLEDDEIEDYGRQIGKSAKKRGRPRDSDRVWSTETKAALVKACQAVKVLPYHKVEIDGEKLGRAGLISRELAKHGVKRSMEQVRRGVDHLKKEYAKDKKMLNILSGKASASEQPHHTDMWTPELHQAFLRAARSFPAGRHERVVTDGEQIGRNQFISKSIEVKTGVVRSINAIEQYVSKLKKEHSKDEWMMSVLKGEVSDLADKSVVKAVPVKAVPVKRPAPVKRRKPNP